MHHAEWSYKTAPPSFPLISISVFGPLLLLKGFSVTVTLVIEDKPAVPAKCVTISEDAFSSSTIIHPSSGHGPRRCDWLIGA